MTSTKTTWHDCKGGCGFIVGLIRDRFTLPGHDAGSVAHTKPREHVNRVPVQCALYRDSTCAQLFALHEREPEVEPPENIRKA